MQNKLLVPDIGDFENVEVIEVLVKKGDKIKKNDPVVTIESDKSSVEVPSIYDGVVETVNVKIGDKVSKDDLLITLNGLAVDSSKEDKIEQQIPPQTENIIKEAEKNIIEKKKILVEENNIKDKIIKSEKQTSSKIELTGKGDIDPAETKEWLESLTAVLNNDGKERAQFN